MEYASSFGALGLAASQLMLTKIPVGVAQHLHGKERNGKGYDNRTPRIQQQQLSGWGARALAAHLVSLAIPLIVFDL
jgi:hypothetical protein